MYKPKPKNKEDNSSNRLKLPTEAGCPSMAKVKFMLEEATNRRGCLVELPWTAGNAEFVSTCQWEDNVEEPVWTLYQEEGGASKIVWTQSFAPSDLEFMYDILVMSAPKGTSSTKIPELLSPEADPSEKRSYDEDTENDVGGSSDASSGSFPQVAPLPQPGLMPGISPPAQPGPTSTPQPVPQPQPQQPQVQAPNVDPNYYQQQSGGYQSQQPYPPQGQHPYPPPQGYPPQGYPPQGQYPGYPPQMPQGYQTPPQQPYNPYANIDPNASYGGVVPVDYHLLDKRPNVLIGMLLKDAGLISEPTLEAALKLQELVRDEKISNEKAPSVLKRLHKMGADIEQHLTPQDLVRKTKKKVDQPQGAQNAPASQNQAAKDDPKGTPAAKRNLKPAFDLLEKAGILSDADVKDALAVRKKHGGDLVGILEAANKLNRKTVDAAFICLPLIREGLMKTEQCIIALNYCSRMRVGFDEALDEMGWQNPRKLRSDLPLN